MKNSETGKELLKISEVAKAAGVSTQTVHYYLREGLLTPPVKTSPNMAYYDPVVIDEIKLIKELQKERYLPISVIKIILEARRQGQQADHVEEMQSVMKQLFNGHGGENTGELLSASELASSTGLSMETIAKFREMGLLTPASRGGNRYGKADERIGRAFKKLLDLGLTMKDLSIYGQYAGIMRSEVRALRGRLIDRVHDGSISLKEVVALLNDLKTDLAFKIYREAMLEERPKSFSWKQRRRAKHDDTKPQQGEP